MAENLFDIDVEGWSARNKNRPLPSLFKEVLQNALDESASKIIITTAPNVLTIRDDSPKGVEELSQLYTIYSSGKEGDSPTVRGRMGRGLKEFITATSKTIIRTTTGTLEFDVENLERKQSPECIESGTIVEAYGKWSVADIKSIKSLVKHIIVPRNMTIELDGECFGYKSPDLVSAGFLPTVIFDNGSEEVISRHTNINMFSSEKGCICEMGIPIQEIDAPYVIDIQQRVPMNPNRSQVGKDYIEMVYDKILNDRLEDIPEDFLGSAWVQGAVSRCYISITLRQYVRKFFGSEPDHILLGTTSVPDDKARQLKFQVIPKKSISKELRKALGRILNDTRYVVEQLDAEKQKEEVETKAHEERFLEFAKKIASICTPKEYKFGIFNAKKDSTGSATVAYHEDDKIMFNRREIDFDNILYQDNIGTIIHELCHEHTGIHETDFKEMYENYTGLVIREILNFPKDFEKYSINRIKARASQGYRLLLDINKAKEFGWEWDEEVIVSAMGSEMKIISMTKMFEITVPLKKMVCCPPRKRKLERNSLDIAKWFDIVDWDSDGSINADIRFINFVERL